jgi:carboxylesterase
MQRALYSALGQHAELVGAGSPVPRRHLGGAPALLGLHGFGATPRELDPVIDVAVELGLCASAPLLPGHGTTLEQLATTGWEDWYRAADRELSRLAADSGEPVVLAGLSLGSLIAMHLAATRGATVRGLILLSPPTRLAWPWPDWFLGAVGPWVPRWFALPKRRPDALRAQARSEQLGYRGYPLRAATEVRDAGQRTLSLLGRIRCPTLIVEGQHDRVCRPGNAREILRKLGARDKHAVLLGRAAHLVTRDYDVDRLVDHVRSFLERVGEKVGARPQRPVDP